MSRGEGASPAAPGSPAEPAQTPAATRAASAGRRPRGQEKRAQIIDAAARVALVHGVAGLSHRLVAAEAGVPLGSTTYYFRSLGELRAAAVARLLEGDRERRAAMLAAGLPSTAPAADVAWHLIELVIGAARLDEPVQVALLYERIAEAARDPDLAEVVRAGQRAVEADAGALAAGTAWSGADPGALVAVVDGRAIGWLALGETQAHLLVDRVAHDLASYAVARS